MIMMTMKRTRRTIAAWLIISGLFQVVHAQLLSKPLALELQSLERYQTLTVQVKINGVPTRLFVSSLRSEPLILFQHSLQMLDIKEDGGEEVPVRSVELIEKTGGTSRLSVASAHVVKISDVDAYVSGVSGILGAGLFAIAPVEIDFETNTMILHSRSLRELIDSQPDEWTVIQLKKLRDSRSPLYNLLPVRLSESLTLDMIIAIDTWYSRIPAKLMAQADLEELHPLMVRFPSTSSSYYLRGKLRTVQVGNLSLRNLIMDFDLDDTVPVLGLSMFYAFHRLIIDMRTGELAVHRSSVKPVVLEGGYTGILLARDAKGQIYVSSLDSLSPADRAGLAMGDVITSIQGIPISVLSLAEAQKLIQGYEGRPVQVQILREGQVREIRFTPVSWYRGELKDRDWELGYYELDGKSYWLIRRLAPWLHALGLRVGDIVTKIDGSDMREALAALVWSVRGREISVRRLGGSDTLDFKIPAESSQPDSVSKSGD
ncbi:MAG: hypothetical protein KatS3mg016_1747 [Fimbriimonadales bacterium]|jgi:hypothetical protein|nr:MAG: hypothetical protein KatS3mg016_1747 [Fimbriimonadales bacterium]GIV07808.1 MAG: hypothetical protein KatS3mg017_1010 [Fimbriimonadales bacterium]